MRGNNFCNDYPRISHHLISLCSSGKTWNRKNYGNGLSISAMIAERIEKEILKKGDLVCMASFGACLVEW